MLSHIKRLNWGFENKWATLSASDKGIEKKSKKDKKHLPVSVCPGLQQLEGAAPWQLAAGGGEAGQEEDPGLSPATYPWKQETQKFQRICVIMAFKSEHFK